MIAICILNYNNFDVTIECCKSILQNPPNEEFRIIIVDNGSSNQSFAVLNDMYSGDPRFIIHKTGTNLGFAAGNEYALQVCEQLGIKICILANSDICFKPETIQKLKDELEKDMEAVIIGPKILTPGGEIQQSSMLKKTRYIDAIGIGRLCPQKRLDEERLSGTHKVASVSGCCFATDIPLMRKMSAFDTNTFLYNEENILCVQASRAFLKTKIDLDVAVIHNHGSSSGKDNVFVRKEYIKSTLYYWKMYRNKGKIALYIILYAYIFKLFLMHREYLNVRDIYKFGGKYLQQLYKKKES